MSNNRGHSGPSNLPFIAVEYGDQKAVISRNPNYQETVSYMKKAFGALRNVQDEDIIISAHLEELDDNFRILDDLWPELLPQLTVVKLSLDNSVRVATPANGVVGFGAFPRTQAPKEEPVQFGRRTPGFGGFTAFGSRQGAGM